MTAGITTAEVVTAERQALGDVGMADAQPDLGITGVQLGTSPQPPSIGVVRTASLLLSEGHAADWQLVLYAGIDTPTESSLVGGLFTRLFEFLAKAKEQYRAFERHKAAQEKELATQEGVLSAHEAHLASVERLYEGRLAALREEFDDALAKKDQEPGSALAAMEDEVSSLRTRLDQAEGTSKDLAGKVTAAIVEEQLAKTQAGLLQEQLETANTQFTALRGMINTLKEHARAAESLCKTRQEELAPLGGVAHQIAEAMSQLKLSSVERLPGASPGDLVKFFSDAALKLSKLPGQLEALRLRDGRQLAGALANTLLSRLQHHGLSFPMERLKTKISPDTARKAAEEAVSKDIAVIVERMMPHQKKK